MRYEYLSFNILVVLALTKISSLASEIPGRDIREQFADRTLQDDICYNVCSDDNHEFFFDQIQVDEVTTEDEGLFGSIFHRFDDVFDTESKFGRLMNGIFTLFRLNRQSNKPRYEISTDVILPVLTNYSIKAKSLAALIRNESVTYAAASDTPDVVTTLFDLSAENMESVASIIDPMIYEMRQNETIDLATISCSIERLLIHIRDETFPNIVSIAEFIYTKSGNAEMVEMYDNYVVSASRTPSDALTKSFNRLKGSVANQCREEVIISTLFQTEMAEPSPTSVQSRLGSVGSSLGCVLYPLIFVIGLIVLYPLSFVVSLATIVFVIFTIILAVVFKKPILDDDDDDTDDCMMPTDDICDSPLFSFPDNIGIILVVIGIASPILIPIVIIGLILVFFLSLVSPLFGISDPLASYASNQDPTTMSNNDGTKDVMQKVGIILESSMEDMIDSIKFIFSNEDREDTEQTLDCELKTISCQNDALVAALPF